MSKSSSRSRKKLSEDEISQIFPWAKFDESKIEMKEIDDYLVKDPQETESTYQCRKILTKIIYENDNINLKLENCVSVAYAIIKRAYGYKYSEDTEIFINSVLEKL